MSDGLDVSGGTTAVSTEDIEVAADQLHRLVVECSAIAAALSALDPVASPWSADDDQAKLDIGVALAGLRDIACGAQTLAVVLRTAAQGYEIAERVAGAAVRGGETLLAQWLGARVPAWLLGSGLFLSFAGGVWAGIRASGGLAPLVDSYFRDNGIPSASPAAKQLNGLWTNPAAVGAIRTVAQSAGPFLIGAAGALPGTAQALGTTSFEVGAKGLIVAGQSVGLLTETGVRLVEAADRPVVAPPRDYVDRLARVPYQEDGSGPQVMIERYSVEGGPDRFAVYVGGTATFSPVATTEPWDMTSNLYNAAGVESGSVASVRAAMAAAGITADSPVQLTGYSQGGGVVARIAASGDYDVRGLASFGGPTGQVDLPHGVPAVLVEHSDDLVPALGGEQANSEAVLVRRDVYGGREVSKEWGVPSHHIENYIKTAHLMDTSGSPQLGETLAKLDAFTDGTTLETSTLYTFERTSG
ncbi:MAG: hypothetical protein BGO97_06540 [Micrococcales bacterium 70-64]|nr:hypothetical protein [Leifsonia sp.]ODU63722.1 MAG: hypothetical protein ABT06_06545 [Leifsonia sp. SCN 70-46]OJX85413.1 MAG: hypothetical protein BGO97_06540 [Micrococcales bacterium 70-64]